MCGHHHQTSGRHSLAKLSNRFSISVERLQATVARSRLEDDSEYIAMLAKVFDSSQFIGACVARAHVERPGAGGTDPSRRFVGPR